MTNDCGVISLAGSGERRAQPGEVDGLKELEERPASAIQDADAAKAYDIASDMEDGFGKLEGASQAILCIANGNGIEEGVGSALHVLGELIKELTHELDEQHAAICRHTWAYRYGYAETTSCTPTSDKEPEWPKETLDAMQKFIDERRAGQIVAKAKAVGAVRLSGAAAAARKPRGQLHAAGKSRRVA